MLTKTESYLNYKKYYILVRYIVKKVVILLCIEYALDRKCTVSFNFRNIFELVYGYEFVERSVLYSSLRAETV